MNFEKILRTFHFEEQQVAASVTIYFKHGMDNANITFSHSRFLEFSFSSVLKTQQLFENYVSISFKGDGKAL